MATADTYVSVDQPTAVPTNKVMAGGVGGAVATVLVVLAQVLLNVEFPVGFEGALAVIFGFVIAYLTRDKVPTKTLVVKEK